MPKVNIGTLKTNIKSLLDAANTTTGSPIDLSSGLTKRVSRVLKIHPGRIPIQPTFFPYVSMFTSSKSVEQLTVGTKGSQLSALRQATLNLEIVGCCYEPSFSDLNVDSGDENVETLMENIELILRSSPNLGYTSTTWSIPTFVQYDDMQFSEEAHLRAGILTLAVKVHY